MKLDANEYFDCHGEIAITEKGWIDMRNFCRSIIYKRVGAVPYAEDIVSRALIECIDALPKYDKKKNNQLGGWEYFYCLGAISKESCAHAKEIPFDHTKGLPTKGEHYDN